MECKNDDVREILLFMIVSGFLVVAGCWFMMVSRFIAVARFGSNWVSLLGLLTRVSTTLEQCQLIHKESSSDPKPPKASTRIAWETCLEFGSTVATFLTIWL